MNRQVGRRPPRPRAQPGKKREKGTRAAPATRRSDRPKGAAESANQAVTRSRLYSILSLAFYRPNGQASEVWRGLTGLLAISGGVPPNISGARAPANEEDLRQLEVEYNRLFVGPGHLPCPPYESVYTKERPRGEVGLLAGPAIFDVKKLYAQAGFQLSDSFKDYPDHISVELEFMGHLCANESKSEESEVGKWADLEVEFVNGHIGIWVTGFAASVLKATSCPFYVAAATLLERFALDEISNLRAGGSSGR